MPLKEIDIADKYQRNVGMNFQEEAEFGTVCKLGGNQLISCYGTLERVGDWNNVYHFAAKCRGCPHNRPLDRGSGYDPFKLSIFDTEFIEHNCQKLLETESPKAFVYFISDGQYVKIGKAIAPERRLGEIQTGNPKKCNIIALIPCKNEKSATKVEGWLHNIYSDYRMEGEWFNILENICYGGYFANYTEHFDPKIYLEPTEE